MSRAAGSIRSKACMRRFQFSCTATLRWSSPSFYHCLSNRMPRRIRQTMQRRTLVRFQTVCARLPFLMVDSEVCILRCDRFLVADLCFNLKTKFAQRLLDSPYDDDVLRVAVSSWPTFLDSSSSSLRGSIVQRVLAATRGTINLLCHPFCQGDCSLTVSDLSISQVPAH